MPKEYELLNGIQLEKKLKCITTKYDRYLFKAAFKEGHVRFSSHDLRRCFSGEVMRRGNNNIYSAKTALRHSDISTTLLYLPPYQEGIKKIINDIQEEL